MLFGACHLDLVACQFRERLDFLTLLFLGGDYSRKPPNLQHRRVHHHFSWTTTSDSTILQFRFLSLPNIQSFLLLGLLVGFLPT